MRDWIRSKLRPVIDGDAIVLERIPGGRIEVAVEEFEKLFGPHVAIPSHSNLVAADRLKGFGYSKYLAQWRKDGLI